MTGRLVMLGLALVALVVFSEPLLAQERIPSTCQSVARQFHDDTSYKVTYANFQSQEVASLSAYEVTISFQGHSTYLIESGVGVKIATDYAGYLLTNIIPDVVTMNQAHSSHYTRFPDPKISHVLRGWGENGTAADHHITVKDVLIRNVTTDILRFETIPDVNSIFIFEIAGLCIGHLGHLHHRLSDSQFAEIGRLDVVMVPVDGGLTLTHSSVQELLNRMRSSVVLPMPVRSSDAIPLSWRILGMDFPSNG